MCSLEHYLSNLTLFEHMQNTSRRVMCSDKYAVYLIECSFSEILVYPIIESSWWMAAFHS